MQYFLSGSDEEEDESCEFFVAIIQDNSPEVVYPIIHNQNNNNKREQNNQYEISDRKSFEIVRRTSTSYSPARERTTEGCLFMLAGVLANEG